MPAQEFEMKPVTLLTTGAIGAPGKRVFYLQARKGKQLLTLIVEKTQVQSLSIGVEQFMAELKKRFPDLPEASGEYDESEMALQKPIDPTFRVGQIGLGYDEASDLMVLVAREQSTSEEEPDQAAVARLWCTRSQLRALGHRGLDVADQGRPICGNCGEPIDPGGHFCPKRNGRKR
ncbi:MAG: DUF3090 domain-containing protein [Anaerolineales bacterium]|jgi:uncharacterized repeat protein (TIGR03847 family)